jgi:hypothetical protein
MGICRIGDYELAQNSVLSGSSSVVAHSRSQTVSGMQVVDSPFAKLTTLMTELVAEQKLPIPRPFMRVALSIMRRSVRKRAAFLIENVAPLDIAAETHVPVLFGVHRRLLTCQIADICVSTDSVSLGVSVETFCNYIEM